MIAGRVEQRLEGQIQACAMMGSMLYACVLEHALADYRAHGALYEFFEKDPVRGRFSTPGLRLMGALNFLALRGEEPELAARFPSCGGDGDADALWRAAVPLLESREARIGELFSHTPQTNEVARSTLLLGGLCAVARAHELPVRLFDLGASAGLNTRLDRYRYEGEGWAWGDARSPLVLRNRVHAGAPMLTDALTIAERAACDIQPLDVESEEDRTRLLSFVWADQPERIDRLRAAFEAARAFPLTVERADLFFWIGERIAPQPGSATVVMHSVMAEHLIKEDRARLRDAIAAIGEAASATAPVAWLRMEYDPSTKHFETRVARWPGAHEQLIAVSDGHAQGITWIG